MPEYTEIKLVWKYHDQDPGTSEPRDCWILYADDKDVAKLIRLDLEFAEKHGIDDLYFAYNIDYEHLFPWLESVRKLDWHALFELSDAGMTTRETQGADDNA
jgi:hypothetical protein